MFKVKGIHVHTTYTPEAQTFVGFSLRWAKEIESFEFSTGYSVKITFAKLETSKKEHFMGTIIRSL